MKASYATDRVPFSPGRRTDPSRRARATETSQCGFTLVELITTIAVAMVLVTIAVPSFYTMTRNNAMTAQANNFTTVLTQARSEGRKRGRLAVICKSDDQATCSTSDSVNWENGWLVYIDSDRDRLLDDDELVLSTSGGLAGESTMRSDGDFSNYIAFLPDGRCIGDGNVEPPAEGLFRICDQRGTEYAREIDVSPSGRASVSRTLGTASCP